MGKAKKHTPEQIVNILRQIEVAMSNGKTTPMASREAGICAQTEKAQKHAAAKEMGDLRKRLLLSLDS